MQFSVIIPTYNRADLVGQAVQSVLSQTLKDFELIVVDDGSVDDTEHVIRSFKDNRVVYHRHQINQGVATARNTGVKLARANYIAFLDDDGVAKSDWLEAFWGLYKEHPVIWAVGGRVELMWPSGRPSWLPPALESYFSRFDLGGEPKIISYPEHPYTINTSIHRAYFLDCGGFSPKLGRKGTNLISEEEPEFFYRLSVQGAKVMYEPRAVVYHHVLPERISKKWLMRRAFAGGRSEVIFSQLVDLKRGWGYWLHQALGALRVAAIYKKRSFLLGLARGQKIPAVVQQAETARYLGRSFESLKVAFSRSR